MLQKEGYTIDALMQPAPGKEAAPRASDPELGHAQKPYNAYTAPAAAVPFWRTRKGMIIIFVAAIVIIGAVVGGAVGGTVGKKSSGDKTLNGNATTGVGSEQGSGQEQPASNPQSSGLLSAFSGLLPPATTTGPAAPGSPTASPPNTAGDPATPPGNPVTPPVNGAETQPNLAAAIIKLEAF